MSLAYFFSWLQSIFFLFMIGLVGWAIAYVISKKTQVRIRFILSYLWTCLSYGMGLRDIEGGVTYSLLGRIVNFPVDTVVRLLKGAKLYLQLGILIFPLALLLSFSIISLPFYIYRLIRNFKTPAQGKGDQDDREQKNG